MCSVVGCDSFRRSAQRFNLPEDPERRLVWVQFLFEVNGQRLKESSWTDITICSDHFTDDCFVKATPATGTVQLKPGALPSLCIKSEPDEPLESPQHVEPVETTDAACQCDDLKICSSPTSCPGKIKHTLTNAGSSKTQQNVTETSKETAALLQMKGKYIVNENCLLELFGRKCPACGWKLQMEKVTYGELFVLNQQCLKCDYRNHWKSQLDVNIPTAEDGHLTGGTQETPEAQLAAPSDEKNPSSAVLTKIVTFSDEESDPSDDRGDGDEGGVSSDGEWYPTEDFLLAEELTKESEEETEDEGEEEDMDSPGGLKINQLCTDCGSFFNILKPHTCEHKIKPFSCNICGKRCVTEISLKNHSRIHDETYEHPCKFCYVTFKTRVDKLKHEQTHRDRKDRYKCPDCPETFTTGKGRSAHLAKHRAPKEFKCGVCGIEFKDVHHLRRHSVVHTGLKPYKCSVCHRGFNQTSHLKSHMRLHTGERPYNCQHCDKRFNHNVSLKSHVQRYHTSSSGRKHETGKVEERANDAGDAEDNGSKGDTDSEYDNEEEEEDTEEEVQKEKAGEPRSNKRSTGRPRGRPKRNAAGSLVLTRELGSNAKTAQSKARRLKNTASSEEESEGEQSGSDLSFDSAEEDEDEEEEAVRKSTGSSSRKLKNDSDSDFDPEEVTKRKRFSSQSSGKSSGKRRGRHNKTLEV